jgi:hypothetical protein
MIKKYLLLFLLVPSIYFAQQERFPVFEECKDVTEENLENCFYQTTKATFFENFKTPKIVQDDNYTGSSNILFSVKNTGEFQLIYINTPYESIKKEAKRVFASFPKITPAWYNNHPIEMQFTLPISFPIIKGDTKPAEKIITIEKEKNKPKKDFAKVIHKQKAIADASFPEHNSQLNIPFTHQRYVDYEFALHKANGTHTASKPYMYNEVNEHFDLTANKKQFLKPEKQTWVGKKLWNEHLLKVTKEDYWLTVDFLLDTQIGKDNSDVDYTFNNSRILFANGGLGKNLSFSATFYESQGRFADYINTYISNPDREFFKPVSSEGLVPGRGKAKGFKTDSFDYPVAEGYLSYRPNKYFNFQFGHGRNFIGDGYRSFVISDVSSPATYLKMDVDFWKFKYTSIWTWGQDVRENLANTNDRAHLRKYIALHYLSININKKLNIGFFEAAVSAGEEGIDISFLNPLMFYRQVEFNRGEDVGNALLGLTAKYKLTDRIALYSQLAIDEFSVGNISDLSDWRNKFALQLGAKYFNAFDVKDLFLQLEFNTARPYTFAHQNSLLNYGHYSQPLAHLWGANFWETIAIAQYKKNRFTGTVQLNFGEKGFDFPNQNVSFGGDIYQSYDDRFADTGNELAQGNTASIFIANAQGSYLLNPSNRLSLFASLSYRNFSIDSNASGFPNNTTTWFSIGIRADLFNWYFDF